MENPSLQEYESYDDLINEFENLGKDDVGNVGEDLVDAMSNDYYENDEYLYNDKNLNVNSEKKEPVQQENKSLISSKNFTKLLDKAKEKGLNFVSLLEDDDKNKYKNVNSESSEEIKQELNDKLSNKLGINDKVKKKKKNLDPKLSLQHDPDRMAQEILMSLLSPTKTLNKLMNPDLDDEKVKKNNLNLKSFDQNKDVVLTHENQDYKFLKYNDDYSKITVEDINGKTKEIDNSKDLSIKTGKDLKLTSVQKELLDKGKTLMISLSTSDNSKHEFAISKNKETKSFFLSPITKEQKEKQIKVIPSKTRSSKIKI